MSKQQLWLWAINHFLSAKSDSFNSIFHLLSSRLIKDRCTINWDFAVTPAKLMYFNVHLRRKLCVHAINPHCSISLQQLHRHSGNRISLTPNIALVCGKRLNFQMNLPAKAPCKVSINFLLFPHCSLLASTAEHMQRFFRKEEMKRREAETGWKEKRH